MEDIRGILSKNKHLNFIIKYRLLFAILTSLILISIYGYSRYLSVLRDGKYTIGRTLDYVYTKGYRKEVIFEYYVDRHIYKSRLLEIKGFESNIKIPNGYYLVVYLEKDPYVSTLVQERPIQDVNAINLDSLNQHSINPKEIGWMEF